jgi:probable rRNA maturation factor
MIARDAELQKLNREFLQHDYPTDVLSFPSGAQKGFAGEIAISLDRARAQAIEQGHSVDNEIRILMLHGLLHLLGMDHERDRGAMRRAETKWRKALELPLALIERAHV